MIINLLLPVLQDMTTKKGRRDLMLALYCHIFPDTMRSGFQPIPSAWLNKRSNI
jgi:hypothetical protein